MATPEITPFQTYKFTDAEYKIATVFTTLQRQWIQDNLGRIAASKLSVTYDPDSPNADRKFQVEHAYHQGQIEALNFLLAESDKNESALAVMLQATAENQTK
jgi:hypothetical protein